MAIVDNIGRWQDMTREQAQKIMRLAVSHYGAGQRTKAIEEMAELTKELCKDITDVGDVYAITEELADVQIMLYQMMVWYDIFDEVERETKYKLDRLSARMARAMMDELWDSPGVRVDDGDRD